MVMAERRKNKKRKDIDPKDLEKKPTKEEYAIARYLKQKLPEKKTTLLGHKVEYFIASKAIDCLLESPWAKNSKKDEIHFHNRDSAVNFMYRMLEQKLFHRAKKIVVQKDSKKKKKDEDDAESGKEKETKKSKDKKDAAEKKEEKDSKKEGEVAEKKKEKKKIKLDMHLEQIFIDSNEPYVWIYDPIPIRTWITGTLMVVATVLICLFPLWPQTIRHYIYYLSVAAAFFLVFIIGLAVFCILILLFQIHLLRYFCPWCRKCRHFFYALIPYGLNIRLVFFVLVWIVTLGKHHIWLLPNLTEDVGFFESFWPLYKYEYKGKVKDDDKDKDKKDKDESQKEKEGERSDASSTDQERKNAENEEDKDKSDGSSSDQERKDGEKESESEESEDDKKDNGFEIIEADDAEEEEEDRKTK